jgi:hypothetical protein
MMQYLYSRKDVLFIVGKYSCDLCKRNLANIAFHYFNCRYLNKEELEIVICGSCAKAMPTEYSMFGNPEIRTAIVVSVVPLGAFPILSPAEFKSSMTIPEAMRTVVRDAKTIDHTRYAGRCDMDDTATIGKNIEVVEHEAQERLTMIENEPLGFLVDMKNATPLIRREDKKQIEVRR